MHIEMVGALIEVQKMMAEADETLEQKLYFLNIFSRARGTC
jgi:hypothetical protein